MSVDFSSTPQPEHPKKAPLVAHIFGYSMEPTGALLEQIIALGVPIRCNYRGNWRNTIHPTLSQLAPSPWTPQTGIEATRVFIQNALNKTSCPIVTRSILNSDAELDALLADDNLDYIIPAGTPEEIISITKKVHAAGKEVMDISSYQEHVPTHLTESLEPYQQHNPFFSIDLHYALHPEIERSNKPVMHRWSIEDVKQLSSLSAVKTPDEHILLEGPAPAFTYAALAARTTSSSTSLYTPGFANHTYPLMEFQEGSDPQSPISWEVEEREDYYMLEFTPVDPVGFFNIHDTYQHITIPPLPDSRKGVIVSGLFTLYFAASLGRTFAKRGVPYFGITTPTMRKESNMKAPAMIVFPEEQVAYKEALPINPWGKLISMLEKTGTLDRNPHLKKLLTQQPPTHESDTLLYKLLELSDTIAVDQQRVLRSLSGFSYVLEDQATVFQDFLAHSLYLLLQEKDTLSIERIERDVLLYGSTLRTINNKLLEKKQLLPARAIPGMTVTVQPSLSLEKEDKDYIIRTYWENYKGPKDRIPVLQQDIEASFRHPDAHYYSFSLHTDQHAEDAVPVGFMRSQLLGSKRIYLATLNIQKEYQGLSFFGPFAIEVLQQLYEQNNVDEFIIRTQKGSKALGMYQQLFGFTIMEEHAAKEVMAELGDPGNNPNIVYLHLDKDHIAHFLDSAMTGHPRAPQKSA